VKFVELADIIKREVGRDLADKVVEAICSAAAGEAVYIPRRPARPSIEPSDTPTAVARKHNVSRSTAYNWVNRWRR
jgi:hypothetical protein